MPIVNPIDLQQSPREVLGACFKSLNGGLPIHGGWGYTQNDACIIDKNDQLVNNEMPFDGVAVEYAFVEKRIYIEMIILRPDGEKFSGIEWKLLSQNVISQSDRSFDRMVFEITAFKDDDWDALKMEYEGVHGYGHPDFDLELHNKKRYEKAISLTREFWFDITSFYG